MITKELIERINYLSRKSRTEGLTPEEKAEQQQVRQEYLAGIRAQMKATLDNIKFVDEPAESACSCSHCAEDKHKHKH